MNHVDITANGDWNLSSGDSGKTNGETVTVYAPADIGGATIVLGTVDAAGTVNPLADGAMLMGSDAYVRCGSGVELVATVTGYSTAFTLQCAE